MMPSLFCERRMTKSVFTKRGVQLTISTVNEWWNNVYEYCHYGHHHRDGNMESGQWYPRSSSIDSENENSIVVVWWLTATRNNSSPFHRRINISRRNNNGGRYKQEFLIVAVSNNEWWQNGLCIVVIIDRQQLRKVSPSWVIYIDVRHRPAGLI